MTEHEARTGDKTMHGEIRERDVFHFRYSDANRPKHMPYHCFDGKLIAFAQPDGSILLRDTYWLSQHNGFAERSDTRTFTVDKAREEGELTYLCNLDEVEQIGRGDALYYDEADVFDMSHQHGSYKVFMLRKGAQKSPDRMRREVERQTEEARGEIRYAQSKIERLAEYAKKIEAGELREVYL